MAAAQAQTPKGGGPALSFVIPAYNESAFVGATVDAIHRFVGAAYAYEVVVVDNGSTDDTARVASAHGARVISRPEGTIGALRNEGVRATSGRFLAFLDADVVITAGWAARLPATLAALEDDPRALTGGMCVVPADAGWLQRTWFAARARAAFTHIGTGQLLTTRRFFDEIGGFDEALQTGEDYDLSRRAERAGGRLVPDAALVAEHRRFPRTLRELVRREAWHGRGDFASIQAVMASKVALATLVFVAGHVTMALGIAVGHPPLAAAAFGGVLALCALSSWRMYRHQPWRIVATNTGVYYAYFVGRTLSLWHGLTGRSSLPRRN